MALPAAQQGDWTPGGEVRGGQEWRHRPWSEAAAALLRLARARGAGCRAAGQRNWGPRWGVWLEMGRWDGKTCGEAGWGGAESTFCVLRARFSVPRRRQVEKLRR